MYEDRRKRMMTIKGKGRFFKTNFVYLSKKMALGEITEDEMWIIMYKDKGNEYDI